jgi:hypothetical protein
MRQLEKTWGGVLFLGCLLAACGDAHDAHDAHDNGNPRDPEDAGNASANVIDADAHTHVDDGVASYVGDVEDSDTRVAVLAGDARARVFFCGGDSSYASATHWFALDIDGDALDVDDGDWHLHAERSSDGVSGTITHLDDEGARGFTAKRVASDTIAGLYEGTAQCGRLGLIVMQSSRDDETHAQGACVGQGHDPEQVNPIFPIALVSGGVQVEAPGEDAKPLLTPAGLAPL